MWQGTKCDISCAYYSKIRGSFLERPRNFLGPKANFTSKPVEQLHSSWFRCIIFKIIKTLILNANITNTKQLSGPEKLSGRSRNGPRSVIPVLIFQLIPMKYYLQSLTNSMQQIQSQSINLQFTRVQELLLNLQGATSFGQPEARSKAEAAGDETALVT